MSAVLSTPAPAGTPEPARAAEPLPAELGVSLLTGGIDKPYAFGLAMALTARRVNVDFIGSDEIDSPELHTRAGLRFLNLRGDQSHDAGLGTKVSRILSYYTKLMGYAAGARPKVFHILWNNKFQLIDRTLLMLFYKAFGKKIVLTAHNVNAGKRDGTDSALNRLTLKAQYRLADHIFVHSELMKADLLKDFGVADNAVTVVHIGVNNSVPNTELTPAQARERLGIKPGDKTLLFFGHIGPYKGLEYLTPAFEQLVSSDPSYRLLIVGKPKTGSERYVADTVGALLAKVDPERVIRKIEFVPDEDTELYFKAADLLVLPYTQVFQSGVLILGYTFGLPVVATDVGSLKKEVIEGSTGFVCRPEDPDDLARTIRRYFASDLSTAPARRDAIREHAWQRYSWDSVGLAVRRVYEGLL